MLQGVSVVLSFDYEVHHASA